jgi:hypothetical protein
LIASPPPPDRHYLVAAIVQIGPHDFPIGLQIVDQKDSPFIEGEDLRCVLDLRYQVRLRRCR